LSPDQVVLIPEAAAVGPIEKDGSAFLLLLAPGDNFLSKLGECPFTAARVSTKDQTLAARMRS
jgi:hypothetical protein